MGPAYDSAGRVRSLPAMDPHLGIRRHRRARSITALGTRLIPIIPFFEDELRLLPTLVPPGGTCLDVGAAHGIYTAAMAAAVGPGGRVVAFEPQPLPRRVASCTRAGLGLRAVVDLHAVALSDREADDVMVVPYRGRLPVSGRAFLSGPGDEAGGLGHEPPAGEDPDGFTGTREIPVRCRPLDQVVEALGLRRVDLVKVDVEGAELGMLAGAERTVSAFRPMLLIEIEERHTARYGHTPDAVIAWFAERAYQAMVYRDGRLRPVEGVVEGARNYLFVSQT